MSKHLLSLSDLDAAAPGVLSVVFGPDGHHEDAPLWSGPITILCAPARDGHAFLAAPVEDDGVWLSVIEGNGHNMVRPDFWPWSKRLVIDLRIPSVAARLLSLLCRAISPKLHLNSWQTAADLATRVSRGEWNDDYAARTAELVRWYAPQIVALGV